MTRFQRNFFWLLLCFIGILSVSGTIALRNVLHVVLLGMFAWALLNAEQRRTMQLPSLIQAVPRAVWAWIGFLLLFPFFAMEPTVARQELLRHWSESILTWVLAFAAVAVLRGRGPRLWALTWASAVPVLLHLALVPLSMAGLLRGAFEADASLPTLGTTLWSLVQHPGLVSIQWQSVMGFRGVEPMHGNIGYPASQTLVLALACWLQARRQGQPRGMGVALGLVVACMVSGLISSSRGTVLFNILLLLLAAGVGVVVHRLQGRQQHIEVLGRHQRWRTGVVGLVAAAVLVSLFVTVVRSDERWQTMTAKMMLGFATEHPLDVLCNGLTAQGQAVIRNQAQGRGVGYENLLKDGVEGQDGARMLLLRAGPELVWQHPRGQDGSRHSFEKVMLQTCGHTPKLAFSHAHNAWINLALSVGWLGVVLFAWLLLSFLLQGWHMLLRQDDAYPLGYALLLLAVFWMLRGMADAVFQEHYLQMQAIMLLILALCQCYRSQENQDLKVG